MTVGIIVVGVGDFGKLHAAVAAALPEISLLGVVDSDAATAKFVAESHGTRSYESLEAALTEMAPDAVLIATPENVHVHQVLECLAAGVHVLVEKPVALSSAGVSRLKEAAEAANRFVLPGHISRFLPEVQDLLADPGEVWSIVASRLVPQSRRALHSRTHPAWMAMIHDLDIIGALLPERPTRVTAVTRRTDSAEANPDLCWAMIEVDDGPVALVENIWIYPHDRQYVSARLRVSGPGCVTEISLPSDALVRIRADGEYRPVFAIDGWVATRPVGALAAQLRHFVDVIEGRVEPLVTLEDARRTARLVEAVIESADCGRTVCI